MGFPTALVTAVGTLTISSLIVRLSRFVYLCTRPSALPRYRHGTDSWALVTGASDGIGKSPAHKLAHHGFNVILHGRNPSKLNKVVSALRQEFPKRSFRTAVLDASSANTYSFFLGPQAQCGAFVPMSSPPFHLSTEVGADEYTVSCLLTDIDHVRVEVVTDRISKILSPG